jgi:hypothetical protein
LPRPTHRVRQRSDRRLQSRDHSPSGPAVNLAEAFL